VRDEFFKQIGWTPEYTKDWWVAYRNPAPRGNDLVVKYMTPEESHEFAKEARKELEEAARIEREWNQMMKEEEEKRSGDGSQSLYSLDGGISIALTALLVPQAFHELTWVGIAVAMGYLMYGVWKRHQQKNSSAYEETSRRWTNTIQDFIQKGSTRLPSPGRLKEVMANWPTPREWLASDVQEKVTRERASFMMRLSA
jgi:hypothetical protein